MFHSLKYSNLALRVSLAFVFLWFGIDKFIHPDYWINAWYPENLDGVISGVGLSRYDFMHVTGVAEILIALSLLSGFFMTVFSLIGLVFLGSITIIFGMSEIMVRDIGLMGGFISLLLWPNRRH